MLLCGCPVESFYIFKKIFTCNNIIMIKVLAVIGWSKKKFKKSVVLKSCQIG